MASTTFNNLPEEKKTIIRNALLNEFSQHNLADAQVARIVKEAGIARGAFYKYFADLTDAYRYLYQYVLQELHDYSIREHRLLTADEYVTQVANFLHHVNGCQYYELVKRHFTVNEALLDSQNDESPLRPVNAIEWAIMTLVHEAIKEGLRHPEKCDVVLDCLQGSLTALLTKEG